MDLKNFFQKIISGNKTIVTPPAVKLALEKRFDNPLNTEWTKIGDQYEAVFYKDELEHIARFDETGLLLSLKVNLPLEKVPALIHKTAQSYGELMNVIAIFHEDSVGYELIVRDEKLTRFSMLLNADGEVIQTEKL